MLSPGNNARLTQVGPDTPMGSLLRRYWIPALLTSELPQADGPPQRLRLLGEDFVVFRDSAGQIGIVDDYCPHRGASLFLGRNEEGGIRCVYHGWKFDVAGHCLDMPNEPVQSRFKEKVRLRAGSVVERGGVIWVYLGPPQFEPDPPAMEWTRASADQRFVSKTWEACNFLQAIEGGIDTVHSSFLHNNRLGDRESFGQRDTAPRLEVERTDYGFRYVGIRNASSQEQYVRIYQFILPFHQLRSHQLNKRGTGRETVPLIKGHMWVPIDDAHTMVFNWMCSADPDIPLTPEFIAKAEASAGRGPDGEGVIRHRTRANNWGIDRLIQRTRTFTGIEGLNTQDLAVQESMGPVVDRSREHLGSTDRAIITFRQILLDAVHGMEDGVDPPGRNAASYESVRPSDVLLPVEARWQEAAAADLTARR